MDNRSSLEQILLLPYQFYQDNNNKSIYTLLKETGYFEIHNEITVNSILEVLRSHEDYIHNWLLWSENKRATSGSYFLKEDDKWIVGDLEPSGKNVNVLSFESSVEACSVFVKRELEFIRISDLS